MVELFKSPAAMAVGANIGSFLSGLKSSRRSITLVGIIIVVVASTAFYVFEHAFVPTTAPTVSEYKEAPVGTATIVALRDSIKREYKDGWVANAPIWPRMFLLYKSNFQLGEWDIWQQVTYNLRFRLSREGRSDHIDEHLKVANSAINNSPTMYMFPSADSKMLEAIDALDEYLTDLPVKKNFHPRANNLYELIDALSSSLGGAVADLNENPDIGPFQGYAPFNYAKGEAYATLIVLEAVQIDFADVLATKHGSAQQLDRAIFWLRQALLVTPWIPLDGGFKINDLAVLSSKISQAQQELGPLADTLRNG
jgi:hypothetical protein